ncbi:Protease precursor [Indibacter alkaliphilus LW1]|uniref:Protease n=1 Tax=Indibacter alkaliphilus (strain CCUG 57479 / KCTC 22604 / LW1) TaxID=1189612 RepID=S2DDY4_INDAL|nr:S8 family peptidase [Indibacter alkaliphilus]EOZ95185.1 Protease precursor [Indibacter alkaliphilus LW1]
MNFNFNKTKINQGTIKGICLLFSGILISSCASLSPGNNTLVATSALQPKKAEMSKEARENWQHLDLLQDTIPGMSVDRAYKEIIKKKKGEKVIVAVIDSGIDLKHEDLTSVLWTNSGEIAGTGRDDDNNGFVDDVHGYNFLGESYNEQLEFARILRLGIGDEAYQAKARARFEERLAETSQIVGQVQQMFTALNEADAAVQEELGQENYTLEDLEGIQASGQLAMQVGFLSQMLSRADDLEEVMESLNGAYDYYSDQLNYNLNVDFDGREEVGDDPYDYDDQAYGNGNPSHRVKDESHGTHVAGIIAADRNNAEGIRGVANNVSIMSVRAVPNGDEYDKDIALAIRYAVDNGAKVINASFGKDFSPNKEWVYEALQYASEKDVLFVHAAGNDGKDLDNPENPNFPNDHDFNNGQEFTDNVITVGALTAQYGPGMIAAFSNYGAKNVDVFAPGAQIYSTMPEGEYTFQSGTSMAAPAVAGLAALIRSYYPKLTAVQVKKIIMESGLQPEVKVRVGGESNELYALSEISKSGKIANVYNALVLANQVSKGKVEL